MILLVLAIVSVNTLTKGQTGFVSDTAITTLKNGSWSDPTVWNSLRIPNEYDSIVLNHDVTVDVNGTCRALKMNGKNLIVKSGIIFNIAGYTPILNTNILVIDSSRFKFISTVIEQEAGTYKYLVNGPVPTVKVGDAIVSAIGDGYIRKVTSSATNGNILELKTTQGDMEDVFKKARFGFGFDVSDLQKNSNLAGKPSLMSDVKQAQGYQFLVEPRTLVTAGPLTLKLTKADFTLTPNLNFDFDYGFDGINSMEISCKNAQLKGEIGLNLLAQGKIDGSRTDTIYRAGKTSIVVVYGVPVHMKMDFFLIATSSYSVDADIQKSMTYTTNNSFNLAAKYQQGSWQNSFNMNSSVNTINFGEANGKAKVNIQLNLKPLFKIRFYSLVAPYIFLDVKQSITGTIASPSLNWDLFYKGWAEPGLGLEVKIFGKKPATDFGPKSWVTDTFNYRTPFKLVKEAGDFQSSTDTINFLPKTIKVKVLDELGATQSNVPVVFKLTQKGKLSVDSVLSDANGIAETLWKIDTAKVQLLEVFVKDGSGLNVTNSPVKFTAIYGSDTLRVIKIFNMANVPAFTTNLFKTVGIAKGNYIYAGTANNGFYKCLDTTWFKSTLLTNNNIADLKTDRFGGLWIAQYGSTGAQAITGGVGYLPDSTNTGYMYYGFLAGSPTRNVRSLFIDKTRVSASGLPRVWTACMAHITAGEATSGAVGLGLNSANPFFNKITQGVDLSLQNGSVQVIGGDSTEIWAFAAVNFGKSQLLRYNADNNAFLGAFDFQNTTVSGMTSSFSAKSIFFDNEGRRWVGLLSGGVLVHYNNSWQNLNLPSIFPSGVSINTNAISQGSLGKIYFGTSAGLVIYQGGSITDEPSYKRLTTLNGLPSNNVLDVIERQDGLLVVATDSGIAFLKK